MTPKDSFRDSPLSLFYVSASPSYILAMLPRTCLSALLLIFCGTSWAQVHVKAINPTAAGEIGINEVTPLPISELRGSIGVNTRKSSTSPRSSGHIPQQGVLSKDLIARYDSISETTFVWRIVH
jgi:hypothetical protein